MKIKYVPFLLFVLVLLGCSKRKTLSVTHPDSPPYRANTAFSSFEDLSSPGFQALKIKYQLDTVFHDEQDEFKRMLLLRDWIRTVIQSKDFEKSYPGEGYPDKILDAALKGQGFHCGHYLIVQNAVMNAYGYVTRCLGAGPGVKGGPDGHHGMNEIWSNQYRKWFLSDAQYNHHFEKNGIPLSALEIRDEYLKNKVADVVLVKGSRRVPIGYDGIPDATGKVIKITREQFAQVYTWIEWEYMNNRFTGWPGNSGELSKVNVFADDYFKNHTWIWDGKPHWAYHTDFMILVNDRNAIEWTPNTITTTVKIDGHIARIDLDSTTPNFKGYQMKALPDGEWKDIPNFVQIELRMDKDERLFRAVNLAGVPGPEHKIVIGG